MARAFRRKTLDSISGRLGLEERHILSKIAGEIILSIRLELGIESEESNLLDPLKRLAAESRSQTIQIPFDDALKKLFPPGSLDENQAHEFRRFSQHQLASKHIENLVTIRASIESAFSGTDAEKLLIELADFELNQDEGSELEQGPLLSVPDDAKDLGEIEIVLNLKEAKAWSMGLNLMRLVLAQRMGLENEGDFEALKIFSDNELEDETESGTASLGFLILIYEFISWLQETIIYALLKQV